MRVLPPRRLASATLCAAFLVGIAGSAAVATDLARERTPVGSRPAVPGAAPLLARIKALSVTGSVPAPVKELLEQSLRKGRLTPGEAHRLGEAAKRSVTEAVTGAPTAAATPATPLAAMTPVAPADTPTSAATPSMDPASSTAVSPSMDPTLSTAVSPSMDPTLSTAASPSMTAVPSAATPSTATGPEAPATPAVPADGAMSQTLGLPDPAAAPPAADGAARMAAPTARDATSDALAALTGAIDALVKADVSSLDDVLRPPPAW
ncbi:hypothetical protein [Streptomyces sp. NPDC047869]|uniref:hypothetical protein n=1 Tax=Streptomyces sp. NPDC047869 TaxID=3154709 RepID=UPI0034549648